MTNTENCFSLRDYNIRPSGSPTDALLTVQKMTLVGTDNKIQTPYKKGSEVGYIAFNKADVGVDGILTFDSSVTGESIVLVLGREMNQSVGGAGF